MVRGCEVISCLIPHLWLIDHVSVVFWLTCNPSTLAERRKEEVCGQQLLCAEHYSAHLPVRSFVLAHLQHCNAVREALEKANRAHNVELIALCWRCGEKEGGQRSAELVFKNNKYNGSFTFFSFFLSCFGCLDHRVYCFVPVLVDHFVFIVWL